MRPFVLVHGSFCGGWVWKFLAPILRAKGHEVHTPTLTGLGANSHQSRPNGITLATHIEDVSNTLFYEDLTDAVLVGHSYAGMIISGVAVKLPSRLASLVYFDAYLPSKGESEVELWPEDQLAIYKADIAAGRRFRKPLSPEILGIQDPELAEWTMARLVPHPLSTYEDRPPEATSQSESIPRAYIYCTQGPIAQWTKVFASRSKELGFRQYILNTGHAAQLTHPKELADMLIEIAQG
ncbi:hypothetical protein A3K78_03485 [Candidatus Bathyarchaeota archaeon RBG_13_52_12]|nr:MAG: hypothetical protein A3K78_03485 [Candidatus Bathyarchaeota archaeon RBG_13_52_12]